MTYTVLASQLDAACEWLPSNSGEVDDDAERIFELIALVRSNRMADATTLWYQLHEVTRRALLEEVPSLSTYPAWRITQ
jgi:hypothetical protein